MGKRLIDATKRIDDHGKRNIAYCKRRKGIVKKAIELSKMCTKKIFMAIHDEKTGRIMVYQSDASFTAKAVDNIMTKAKPKSVELVTNDDYDKLKVSETLAKTTADISDSSETQISNCK